jgi:hypothetical protein
MRNKKYREILPFYLQFVVEHVLVLVDRDEGDDEQKHRVVLHAVDVRPYVVRAEQNTVQHYAIQIEKVIENIKNLRKRKLTAASFNDNIFIKLSSCQINQIDN